MASALVFTIELIIPVEALAAELDMPLAYPQINTEALNRLGRHVEDCFHGRGACYNVSSLSNIDTVSDSPFLPRRVIDVGDANKECSPWLRLHESAKDERAHYTTLSHRWGNKILFQTNLENIEAHRTGIDFNALPMSFRDAVIATRALGVRYLWIDAICIIQDDHSDWIDQAPLMGKIYKNARCTLAAHSAQNSTAGFLECMSSPNPVRVADCISPNGVAGKLCIGSPRSFKETIDYSHIKQRGWVLQELTLSRRTAHFSNGYIYWDCPHMTTPQSVGYTTEPSIQASPAIKTLRSGADFVGSWFDLVTDYSKCELTYGTDKLVAISGIAAEWQNHLGEGRGRLYHSGLFACGLPQGLLWYSGGGSLKKYKQRAPSWSWASVDGRIQFMNDRNAITVATVNAVDTDVDGDVIADSPDCQLSMHASVKVAYITGEPLDFGIEPYTGERSFRRHGVIIKGSHMRMDGHWTGGQASIDIGSIKSRSVLCARICTTQVALDADEGLQVDFVLLLERMNPKSAQYRRIGVGTVIGKGLFDGLSPQDIFLI